MIVNSNTIYKRSYQFSDSIHIQTKRTSLVLGIAETVYQIHHGARLDEVDTLMRSGLAAQAEEYYAVYSSFGVEDNHGALRITHPDGSLSTELSYDKHFTEEKPYGSYTSIDLTDKVKGVRVTLHFQAYTEEDVIEQWVTITNENGQDGALTVHEAPASGIVYTHASDYYLTTFTGLWEREGEVQEEKLQMGAKVLDNRYGTWSSFGFNPAFMLSFDQPACEDSGSVLVGALAWTGAWKMKFDLNYGIINHDTKSRQALNVRAGSNDVAADYKLADGESYETPKLITSFTDQGKGEATRNLHKWARKYGLRDGDQQRPILLNSWEGAYFNFDEATLLSMMNNLAEMGGEMFVLDDGWFGNGENARNGSRAGLGDWQVNTEKLPNGLTYLAEQANDRWLEFGIWVEPEMVNPKSQLFTDHPEWAIHQPERDAILYREQLVLDLSNPEVQEFVYKSVADLLAENPKISYVKWDCNRNFMNVGSTYLSADKQTHLWLDYVKGLYGVYERLAKNFPKVMIQVCASGGGRIDYGALKYHHEFWASDNTDALQRIFIQWGLGHIYPSIASASHVSICPNHQTGRTLPLKFRFDVAMSGRMGLELDPKDMSAEELCFVKEAVACYKEIRPVVQFGDLYRLYSPYDNDIAAIEYLYGGRAIAFVYKIKHHLGQAIPKFKVKGLDPTKMYRLDELNTSSDVLHSTSVGKVISGAILMNVGISLTMLKEYDSATFSFTEV